MDEKEILAMEPGLELDIIVSEEIMENKIVYDECLGIMERTIHPIDGSSVFGMVLKYSEDMDMAELVINRMKEKGYEDAGFWPDFGGGVYTEAEAVCKAALCALLKKQESDIADNIIRQALEDETES
jgi:hypothetical protein